MLLQNHQIKILSEEASTLLKATERANQAPANGAAAASSGKVDAAEGSGEEARRDTGSEPSKPGLHH